MKNPVQAAQFSTPQMAALAAGMLENNGIACVVEPSEMSTLYGAGSTWAPVRVFVPQDRLDDALRLLREHGDI